MATVVEAKEDAREGSEERSLALLVGLMRYTGQGETHSGDGFLRGRSERVVRGEGLSEWDDGRCLSRGASRCGWCQLVDEGTTHRWCRGTQGWQKMALWHSGSSTTTAQWGGARSRGGQAKSDGEKAWLLPSITTTRG
jgi:hypothetical protein